MTYVHLAFSLLRALYLLVVIVVLIHYLLAGIPPLIIRLEVP